MKSKHARTLAAIFTKPTLGGIVFSDIESLVAALGGEIHEGAGSRIAFELNGTRRYHHTGAYAGAPEERNDQPRNHPDVACACRCCCGTPGY